MKLGKYCQVLVTPCPYKGIHDCTGKANMVDTSVSISAAVTGTSNVPYEQAPVLKYMMLFICS